MSTHVARKRFGQNFLIDQFIIAEIIALVDAKETDHIVEIGPGQAALTRRLIQTKATIDAIEVDRDLVEHLRVTFSTANNFIVHSADVLDFDFSSLVNKNQQQKLRLVGNLPYNISTSLMFKMFENIALIKDMHFMLQREVAERLTAAPGNKEYGRMSVMAQYYCQMQIVLDVPPTAFDPAPKVDSSIVRFIPHTRDNVNKCDTKLLQKITTLAFNQRRKTIANALKEAISSQELEKLNIKPTLRAENLSLEDYTKIISYIQG